MIGLAVHKEGASSCKGQCANCSNMHIKVIGHADHLMHLLSENLREALLQYPDHYHLAEITDPISIETSSAQMFPALYIDGVLRAEGRAPAPEELQEMFRDRQLTKSKIIRLKSVLVPVDKSETSANALRFAWKMAEALGLDIEVVFALDQVFEVQATEGFLSKYKQTMQKELNVFVQETLQQMDIAWKPIDKTPEGPGVRKTAAGQPFLETRLLFGFPDIAIARHSKNVDLIVMGTTGRGGTVVGKLFGTVSTAVSKNAHCPVLFVPNEAEFRGFKNLLYAWNEEAMGRLQVQQAALFARRFEGLLHFVHVAKPGEADMTKGREILADTYLEIRPKQQYEYVNITGNEGVVSALNEYALFHRIDLLIFVTRRRSFWENLLHESTTQNALLSGAFPILVIHADDDL
jgi:nucleotide-binding universal stress UspA family protein